MDDDWGVALFQETSILYMNFPHVTVFGRRNHRDRQGYEKLGEVEEEEDGNGRDGRSLQSQWLMYFHVVQWQECQHRAFRP